MFNFFKSTSWETVSNAFLRSKKTAPVCLLFSKELYILVTSSLIPFCVWIPFLNPYCLGFEILLSSKKVVNLLCSSFFQWWYLMFSCFKYIKILVYMYTYISIYTYIYIYIHMHKHTYIYIQKSNTRYRKHFKILFLRNIPEDI